MNFSKVKFVRDEFCVIFSYILLSLIATFPLVFHLNSHVIGNDNTDVWQRLWNTWWLERCVLNFKTLSYTNLLYYPTGTSLVFHDMDFSNLSISFLLQRLFSLVTAYNLLVLLSLTVSAYAMYLLAKYLISQRLAAFFSGIIFAYCPYILSQIFNGITGLVWSAWIPLYILYLFKSIKEKDKNKNIFLSAIFLFLTAINSGYYFIYLVIFTAVFLAYYHKDILNRRFLISFSVAILVFIFLSLPFIYLKLNYLLHGQAPINSLHGMAVMTNLESFFLPFKANQPDIAPFFYHIDYIGWTVIILVLLSLRLIPEKKEAKFWLFTLVLFLILAQGPFLQIGNKEILPNLFYVFLHRYFPFFSTMRFPYRFIIMAMLSASILSGYVLAGIFERNKHRLKTLIVASICLILIMAEFLFISLPPWPFRLVNTVIPSFYYDISKDNEDYALIEVPIKGHKCLYYQTIHGKKMIGGYLSYSSPSTVSLFIKGQGPLNIEKSNLHPDCEMPKGGLYLDERSIASYHIKYIILHRSLVPKNHADKLDEILRSAFNDRTVKDGMVIYRIF